MIRICSEIVMFAGRRNDILETRMHSRFEWFDNLAI
jgi:hypothetical protein